MKGVVFTEFIDFVAERFGDDAVDDVIDASRVPSGGAYTAVGTYPPAEMTALCGALAAHTGLGADQLVRDFGVRLSRSFERDHPAFFARSNGYFDFIESIEGHIHVQVRKLYPDAELPVFQVEHRTPTRLVLLYRSPRRMGHLAEGLLIGAAPRFGVVASVRCSPVGDDADATRFTIDIADAPSADAPGSALPSLP